jgi:hypothetical protein
MLQWHTLLPRLSSYDPTRINVNNHSRLDTPNRGTHAKLVMIP